VQNFLTYFPPAISFSMRVTAILTAVATLVAITLATPVGPPAPAVSGPSCCSAFNKMCCV
jgi:hypothetical protein